MNTLENINKSQIEKVNYIIADTSQSVVINKSNININNNEITFTFTDTTKDNKLVLGTNKIIINDYANPNNSIEIDLTVNEDPSSVKLVTTFYPIMTSEVNSKINFK